MMLNSKSHQIIFMAIMSGCAGFERYVHDGVSVTQPLSFSQILCQTVITRNPSSSTVAI